MVNCCLALGDLDERPSASGACTEGYACRLPDDSIYLYAGHDECAWKIVDGCERSGRRWNSVRVLMAVAVPESGWGPMRVLERDASRGVCRSFPVSAQ